jgi:hypothetical protein
MGVPRTHVAACHLAVLGEHLLTGVGVADGDGVHRAVFGRLEDRRIVRGLADEPGR